MFLGFSVFRMRTILPLFLMSCLAAGTLGLAEEDGGNSQIRQWVQQLGNESFLVRQRAETHLIRLGIPAYSELQRVKQKHDVEVSRRAEYILSKIEQDLLDLEDREVAFWILNYMTAPNPAFKARIIWLFADPTSDFPKGEGLQTLCRLVRFEENPALRLESVKTLIASPPALPTLRQKWYQYIRDNFHDPGDDTLFQTLAHYAKLWCEMDDSNEKTTPDFQSRVRQVSAETMRLLERPENTIQIGSGIDILLHYAVAELQASTGLTEDCNKTVASALATEPKPMQTSEPIQQIGLTDGLPLNEHFFAGQCLKQRFRLHWASAHFRRAMETDDLSLHVVASREVIDIATNYFADYASAIAYWDKHIEVLHSPDYKAKYNPTEYLAQAQKQRAYCVAAKAAEEENWEKVRDCIMQTWSVPDATIEISDIDMVILAYRLCKEQPGIGGEFRHHLEQVLTQLWRSISGDYDQSPPEIIYNTAAWLLANTDGDYQSALTLVETALKTSPDDAMIMDTLAHVYFLGGNIEEAIRTQEQVVRLAPEAVIFRKALERFKQAK